MHYIVFLVTTGLSAPFFEIFTYVFSDLSMTLLHNCFMDNNNDVGMVNKFGFDTYNHEYVDRFNITILSFVINSVFIEIIIILFTINTRNHIDQKISDLVNIKAKQ